MMGTFAAITGPLVGSRIATSIAETIPITVPGEYTQLIGPAGALIGLIVALRWMTGRLNKSEEKYDARQKIMEDRERDRYQERDQMLKTLIEIATETKNVIWQNSKTIEQFEKTIDKCPGQFDAANRRAK